MGDQFTEKPGTDGARRYRAAHVPVEMIRSLDTYNDPKMAVDPFGAMLQISSGARVYWDDLDPGFKRGCWVITKAQDIRFVLSNSELFKPNNWVNPQRLVGEKWKLIPNTLEGDEHVAFRRYMLRWFSGARLAELIQKAEISSTRLIEHCKNEGGCEFIDAYARPLPISIILGLLGLPLERMPEFLQWEYDMVLQSDFNKATIATQNVIDELKQLIVARHETRADDLASENIDSMIMGRQITDEENLSILYAIFLAGLDTVATSLGWQFRALATDRNLQDRLRKNPNEIPAAVEELYRRYSPTVTRRQAMQDVQIGAAQIKAGDWLCISTSLGSLDPDEYENPLAVDIDRKNKRHFAFAHGEHQCLGARLARAESAIAIRQWLEHIPEFRLADETPVTHGGLTLGIKSLHLIWK
jgi:cytochrome P450